VSAWPWGPHPAQIAALEWAALSEDEKAERIAAHHKRQSEESTRQAVAAAKAADAEKRARALLASADSDSATRRLVAVARQTWRGRKEETFELAPAWPIGEYVWEQTGSMYVQDVVALATGITKDGSVVPMERATSEERRLITAAGLFMAHHVALGLSSRAPFYGPAYPPTWESIASVLERTIGSAAVARSD
jgi:hypothetical protein